MNSISFTVEEENLICMYHHDDRRRTMTAISGALPDMGEDMRQLAEQTIQKLHNMTVFSCGKENIRAAWFLCQKALLQAAFYAPKQ